jgi:predicted aminopeptidase
MLTERVSRILLAGVVLAGLPGCATMMYGLQAAHGEAELLHERRPISQVIDDPHTPAAVRAELVDMRDARDFASNALALPDNKSYRTYVDLQRPYVVWNVVATPEFSVTPKHWCFPVAGCVAYRGYFTEDKARAFAAQLKKEGYDVVLGGVPDYSTLGAFADPVLNTMLPYGDVELAGIIFHELAHQKLYVAGDSAFNEAFATAVADEGLKRWLTQRGQQAQLQDYLKSTAGDLDYIRAFRRRRAQLQQLYASGLPPEQMRERKRVQFDELAQEMREIERRQGTPSPYRYWLERGLNNADLASVATYYDCVPGFERLLQAHDGDLPAFYAAARELTKLPRAERDARLCGSAQE